jgi:hypothetical protein
MGMRVLTVAFCPDLAVPSAHTEDVGCLALLTKVPTLATVRALVPGSLARGAAIFRGAGGQMTDDRCVGSGRGRGKWCISGAGKV